MLEQLKLLVKLQKLDKTLYDLTQELEAIPERLAELSQAEDQLKTALDSHQAALKELQERRKLLEKENEEAGLRVRKAENRLMASKNQREYRAATAEIQEGKDSIKSNDDSLVVIMEQQEGVNAKITELKNGLDTVQHDSEEQKKLLSERGSDLEIQVKKLAENREGLTKGVDLELMDRYDFIRKNRQGVALAPVSKGVCGACHMRIPPQQFNELQRMDRIMDCPTCRRLIYWADAEQLNGI